MYVQRVNVSTLIFSTQTQCFIVIIVIDIQQKMKRFLKAIKSFTEINPKLNNNLDFIME